MMAPLLELESDMMKLMKRRVDQVQNMMIALLDATLRSVNKRPRVTDHRQVDQ
jgi:hypothetical protein